MNFWAAGFWAAGFWSSGFWDESLDRQYPLAGIEQGRPVDIAISYTLYGEVQLRPIYNLSDSYPILAGQDRPIIGDEQYPLALVEQDRNIESQGRVLDGVNQNRPLG